MSDPTECVSVDHRRCSGNCVPWTNQPDARQQVNNQGLLNRCWSPHTASIIGRPKMPDIMVGTVQKSRYVDDAGTSYLFDTVRRRLRRSEHGVWWPGNNRVSSGLRPSAPRFGGWIDGLSDCVKKDGYGPQGLLIHLWKNHTGFASTFAAVQTAIRMGAGTSNLFDNVRRRLQMQTGKPMALWVDRTWLRVARTAGGPSGVHWGDLRLGRRPQLRASQGAGPRTE